MKIILQDYLEELEKCSEEDLERRFEQKEFQGLIALHLNPTNFDEIGNSLVRQFFVQHQDYLEEQFRRSGYTNKFSYRKGEGSLLINCGERYPILLNSAIALEERKLKEDKKIKDEAKSKEYVDRIHELAKFYNCTLLCKPYSNDNTITDLVYSKAKTQANMLRDIGNLVITRRVPFIFCLNDHARRTNEELKVIVYHPSLDK